MPVHPSNGYFPYSIIVFYSLYSLTCWLGARRLISSFPSSKAKVPYSIQTPSKKIENHHSSLYVDYQLKTISICKQSTDINPSMMNDNDQHTIKTWIPWKPNPIQSHLPTPHSQLTSDSKDSFLWLIYLNKTNYK